MSRPILAVRDLRKSLGPISALQEFDLEIQPGEIHALVGPRPGKSTMLQVLAGVLQPDAGEIWLDGRRVRWTSPEQAVHAGIRTVFDQPSLFEALSVRQNILLRPRVPWRRLRERGIDARLQELLDRLGLHDCLDVPTGRLTLGEQKLVAIARAIWHKPRVLLLDAPGANLSASAQAAVLAELSRLKQEGAAVLYTGRSVDEVFATVDKVTLISKGRKVTTSRLDQIDVHRLITLLLLSELGTHGDDLHSILSQFLYGVSDAREYERNRIASDLHDGVKQTLQAALMVLRNALAPQLENNDPTAVEAEQLLRDAIEEIGLVVADLPPVEVERGGLIPALERHVATVSRIFQLRCNLTVKGDPFPVPLRTAVPLYRIAQEAIQNVRKHAQAKWVTVQLHFRPDDLTLLIQDNGQGFAVDSIPSLGLGLSGIRQRSAQIKATCSITSLPGTGTQVRVTLDENALAATHTNQEQVS